MRRFQQLVPFAISVTLTSLFFIDFCAWVFRCGCHSLWAGADAACNIHAMHGRHCPWCAHGTAGYAVVVALVCAPQLAVSMSSRWGLAARTISAIALFPVTAWTVALVFGWFSGYW